MRYDDRPPSPHNPGGDEGDDVLKDPYLIQYPYIAAVADDKGTAIELIEVFDCIGGAMWSKYHYAKSPVVRSVRNCGSTMRYLLEPGSADLDLQGSRFPAGICGAGVEDDEIEISYIGLGGGGVGASGCRSFAGGVNRCLLLFDVAKSDLQPAARQNLANLSTVLQKYADTEILIEGHTDSDGADDYNMTLSRNRANAVANELAGLGVDATRFTIMAYGEAQPLVMELMNRAVYEARFVRKWLPAMPQVVERLKAGGSAIDVGCGTGVIPVLLAPTFAEARVAGLDFDARSIEIARENARDAGVGERIDFKHGSAAELEPPPTLAVGRPPQWLPYSFQYSSTISPWINRASQAGGRHAESQAERGSRVARKQRQC